TEYDQLAVTGTAALGGTLKVALNSGFTPAIGQAFNVATYASPSLDFASFEGLVAGSRRLRASKEPTIYVLTGDGNSTPQANPDTATTIESQPTAPISVLLNDIDPD